ncbi:MAG: Mur ligase domain-containing protein [Syntrophales bacterium]|nr:Mur ligase domain-containing protein [Syntrophales bacterium]
MKKYDPIHGMQRKVQCIHFVGIGGIGMSGIAEVLLNLKYTVTGSDLNVTDTTQRLGALGALIFQGHREEHIRTIRRYRKPTGAASRLSPAPKCLRNF